MIRYAMQIEKREHDISADVVGDNNDNNDDTPIICNWGRLIQQRLCQQYPDLTVEMQSDPKTDKLIFGFEFKNRPTSEADVLNRLFDFLRDRPSIKIYGFELVN